MTDKLVTWLNRELKDQRLSMRQLAENAGISHSTVSNVLSKKQRPTWDFCAGVAQALGVPVDDVFIMAGLKPSLPPSVAGEKEVLSILRGLPAQTRETVTTMMRALAYGPRYQTVAEEHGGYEVDPDSIAMMKAYQELPEEARLVAIAQVRQLKEIGPPPRIIGDDDEEEWSSDERPREEDQAA